MNNSITLEDRKEIFINKANEIHGYKYDYSKVVFINMKTPVTIICKKHGEFNQEPFSHYKHGCKQCGIEKRGFLNGPESFLEKAHEKYGDTYDYSKMEYINASTKIAIVCKKHGLFYQTPSGHIKKDKVIGCPKCAIEHHSKVLKECYCNTIDERMRNRIQRCKEIFGDRLDFSKVEKKRSNEKVTIVCKKHGSFKASFSSLLAGYGCKKCGNELRAQKARHTPESFINKSIEKHGFLYDYSLVTQEQLNDDMVEIICRKHGVFKQYHGSHLEGHGCPMCGRIKSTLENRNRVTREKFIEDASATYNNKFDYSLLPDVFLMKDKIKIICPIHGVFETTGQTHRSGGSSCRRCNGQFRTRDELLELFYKKHGHRYEYPKDLEYNTLEDWIDITCCKHGPFRQRISWHIQGRGCPQCNNSTLENQVSYTLKHIGIEYRVQETFEWLRLKNHQRLDFYIPSLNIGIECQGMQHFTEIGGIFPPLEKTMLRDSNKFTKCAKHGIEVIYYYPKTKDTPDEYLGKSFHTIEDLKNYILQKQSEQ